MGVTKRGLTWPGRSRGIRRDLLEMSFKLDPKMKLRTW